MLTDSPPIYHVYILSQVANEIMRVCQREVPNEALGRLLGYRLQWQGQSYIKIVDWVGGEIENSHTHARFTVRGTRECEVFLDERYGLDSKRPQEIGLFHSHPFGVDPHFSSTDHTTFLNFPYDREGNVFVLIDPLANFFKVYRIALETQSTPPKKYLEQIPWIVYQPKSL